VELRLNHRFPAFDIRIDFEVNFETESKFPKSRHERLVQKEKISRGYTRINTDKIQ
jgi:hypothetical protein